jgi:8-oxo-dGTP pyrophosphatase MutT (NUDIX family)
MTVAVVGTVDVFVLRHVGRRWRCLTLQRAPDTRCPGGWETVHGRIEPGELPAQAAVREVREETGLPVQRLYSIGVNPFYLVPDDTVQLAVVFAAIVEPRGAVRLGPEHVRSVWRDPAAAARRFLWPHERTGLRDALAILRGGDAGPAEDVLRIPVP